MDNLHNVSIDDVDNKDVVPIVKFPNRRIKKERVFIVIY